MVKLTKRKGFNFFRSYYDVFNELESNEDKLAFIEALLDRQFLGIKPTNLKGMAKFAYISQTNSIDSQVKGYEDKTGDILTPTEPPTQGVDTPPTKQVEVKEKVKDIEERKVNFANSLKPYLSLYGADMLNDFYAYWTEHGDKDKKFRSEKQTSFSIERRLETWKRNENKFGNKHKTDKL